MSTELLLQSSFTSDETTTSSDYGSSTFSNTCTNKAYANQLFDADNQTSIFRVRTRHLSCIEENDADSYSSLPTDVMKDADDAFKDIFDNKSISWEAEDIDCITTLDESRILDIESYEQLNKLPVESDCWTATTYGPLYQVYDDGFFNGNDKNFECDQQSRTPVKLQVGKYPKIMTTSCYGQLNTLEDNDSDIVSENSKNGNDNTEVDNIESQINSALDSKGMSSSLEFSGSKADNILELSVISADGSRFEWGADTISTTNVLTALNTDLQSIKKLLENENLGSMCPSCQTLFDKGKKRKLIDSCGHEICYSCMFRNEHCPICSDSSLQQKDIGINQLHGYDTGIGGSTTTIVSPLGSPQLQPRQHFRSNNIFSKITQARQDSVSPELQRHCSDKFQKYPNMKPQYYASNRSCLEISTSSCATPQNRRKIFNAKSIRSFGLNHRRSSSNGCVDSTTLSDDEGGNVKPVAINRKCKSSHNELQTRLGFFLENKAKKNSRIPLQSFGSLASENTSPMSTLTGSSEADMSRVNQQSIAPNAESDSIGSSLSMSVSEQSNLSSKCPVKRYSAANSHGVNCGDVTLFKNRKSSANRSARLSRPKDSYDLRSRAAQYKAPQLTLKPLFFEVPLQEPDPLFVGRQWLLRELSSVLTTTETPGVLINGNPGTGKTGLILQLVEYSCFGRKREIPLCENDGLYCQISVGHDRIKALASHVVAYHFCQADNNITCLVPDFIHSLAAQLCQAPQLSAYREYLINEPHLQNILSIRECTADPKRVMQMAILEPLTVLKRTGKIPAKNCVILVDALCEAEYHRPDHGYTVASFISKMTEHFPSWLKVVATVRTQMLEFVKGLAFTKMTLDSWSSNEYLQKDMLEYITFRVNHSLNIQNNVGAAKDTSTGQFKFITHLLSLTKGSFLYAKLILDLVERGHLVVKSTSYKVLPVSLAEIFLLHFNLRFPTTSSFDKTAQILDTCLAALYPLTLSEIYYSLCALKIDEFIEWDDFLQRFKSLSGFLVKRIDNTYMFFHPSFREWLMRRDEGESSKFLCDFRLGHAAIAFRLSRFQAPLSPEQTLELGHHILKAHIYRNSHPVQSPRDIQSYWITSVTDSTSSALCTLRNVYSPNIKVSRLLLLAGASPDYHTDFMGDAPLLCIAAYEGIVPMVSLLLEFGADVENTNSQGCTPLILAAMKGHCDVVRLLIAAGSSLGQVDTTQRCALVHACRMGKVNVVKYLLACDWIPRPNSADVSLEEAAQQSLVAAASQENITIVEDLLDMSEVYVNGIDSLSGETALTAAAKSGCTESVSVLLSRGAVVDTTNKRGSTSLLIAVKEGHWAVVEKLLQNGANIEQTDSITRKTPLIIAAEEGHVGIIELLVDKGATLEACDNEGLTALCWGCLRGRFQAAKCLIEKGSNKDHSDKVGRTPLDLAAYQGSSNLVQLLLDKGSQMEHVDMNGMRPIDRAIACRNIQVVQVFLKRGAKLGPATWAMAAGKTEIMLLLLNKLLEDGNILYRKNRLQDATYRYQYALKKIPNTENSSELAAAFTTINVNLLLNLSRCKRKMNEPSTAIDLATQAINLKPTNYEGYYARAKAHLEQNNLQEALNDSNLAIKKATIAPVDVREILERLNEEINVRICKMVQEEKEDKITDL